MFQAYGKLILLAGALTACAQTAFEVASIKPHQGPMYNIGVSTAGQQLRADSANLLILVMYAYDLKNYQIAGTSPVFEDELRWDILAKSEGDRAPTKAEFRLMLQKLLADRFKLMVHRESREMNVFALVVDKSGPKFKPSAPDADVTQHYGFDGRNNIITMPKATMSDVVDAIRNAMLDRPVVDRTELTGAYEVRLTYTPETRRNRENPEAADISIFTAVRTQLGLRLEPRKAAVDMMVIDSAQKPSEN